MSAVSMFRTTNSYQRLAFKLLSCPTTTGSCLECRSKLFRRFDRFVAKSVGQGGLPAMVVTHAIQSDRQVEHTTTRPIRVCVRTLGRICEENFAIQNALNGELSLDHAFARGNCHFVSGIRASFKDADWLAGVVEAEEREIDTGLEIGNAVTDAARGIDDKAAVSCRQDWSPEWTDVPRDREGRV